MRKVLGNNFLAQEITKEETESGILRPQTAATEKMRYKVCIVGESVGEVRVDDTVYVAPKVAASRHSLIVDGEEYTVFSEDNVLIIERE
jgi:co-chaperonin GroES (HSP10)